MSAVRAIRWDEAHGAPAAPPAGRRIALVLPVAWDADAWTTDPSLIGEALRAAGHRVTIHCPLHAGTPAADIPVRVAHAYTLRDPAYWRGQGIELAYLFTWLVTAGEIVAALREAGATVVQKADSDGLDGVREHPRAQLVRTYFLARPEERRAKLWMFARKWLWNHRKEDAKLTANFRHCAATTIESVASRRELLRFVGRHCPEVAERIHVVYGPLHAEFRTGPVPPPTDRARRVLAIGRWNDPQKDAPLVAEALRRFLCADPHAEVEVFGAGGEPFFLGIERCHYRGRVPRARIAQALGESRTLFFASRWEGTPMAGCEMLCRGGTIVGPASLPGVAGLIEGGFGTLAPRRTPRALARALTDELAAWDAGRRDPEAIATLWRPRFDPAAIAQHLLDALPAARTAQEPR